MSTIKVKVHPQAGETACAQILANAREGMPNSNPHAAEVIRDGNGKVVQVLVGLPDGDAPGLANAAAKITANSGVATVVEPFPKAGEFNFDSESPGSEPAFPKTASDITITSPTSNPYGEWEGADAADSAGAAGSALELQINPTTAPTGLFVGSQFQIDVVASENGLSAINAYKIEFKLKYKKDVVSSLNFTSVEGFVTDGNGTEYVAAECLDGADENWLISSAQDTLVGKDAFLSCSFERHADGSKTIICGSATKLVPAPPFIIPDAFLRSVFKVSSADSGLGIQPGENLQLILDDLKVTINS